MKYIVATLSLLLLIGCKFDPRTYDDPVIGFGSNGPSPNKRAFIYADNDGKTYFGDEMPLAPTYQLGVIKPYCKPGRYKLYPKPTPSQVAYNKKYGYRSCGYHE